MQIRQQQAGEFTELVISGRLDGYWADHLTGALEEVVRGGADQIRLDLSGITYISSMGVRVLLQFYQQLQSIHGVFAVAHPSEPVKKVLQMMGLGDLLFTAAQSAPVAAAPETARQLERLTALYDVFDCVPGASLQCALMGDPGLLATCGYRKEHSQTVAFPDSSMAIGLGAFGNDFDDCQSRFGEFLCAAGAAAYQPADGSNVPDYLMTEGAFVPELQVLYSLVCRGSFARLARFEAKAPANSVTLSDVTDVCLEVSGSDLAGMVIVAESAGLMGAALRRSPAQPDGVEAPLQYPEVRRWLSYSPERSFTRSLVVVAGVISRSGNGPLAPMLRPIGNGSGRAGHFHAAAFSYRPLQKGRVDLTATIKSIFQAETLQGVLHLLEDNRDGPARQSEFLRGACWVSPIGEIA
jgi:anti-anti-sigma factor